RDWSSDVCSSDLPASGDLAKEPSGQSGAKLSGSFTSASIPAIFFRRRSGVSPSPGPWPVVHGPDGYGIPDRLRRTFAPSIALHSCMSQTTFSMTPPVFFQRLREVTDAYFKENNLRKTGDARLYWKTAILLTALVGLYITLVFFTPANAWLALGLCAVLGVVVASVGFNVMHDGAHGSYSRRKWVNELMGHSLNLLGGSVHFWKLKHNINHHTFTNVEGMDDDIDIKPWVRVHEGQTKYWFHRFQHIYGL